MGYLELIEKYKNYSVEELKESLVKIRTSLEKEETLEEKIHLNESLYSESFKKNQYSRHDSLINEFYYVRDLIDEKA